MNARTWNTMAKDYFSEVVSPFQPGVVNPLLKRLAEIPGARRKCAADLGCGIGNLLPYLCPRFGRVIALDFAARMLKECRARHGYANVEYIQRALSDLKPLRGMLDVAVAVNSVLASSSLEVDRILGEIGRSLKPGGRFLGIFPSMEAVLYQGRLILDRELEKPQSEARALRNTHRIFEKRKYRFLAGLYDEAGGTQKFFYSFELRRRMRRAGFRNVRLGKVKYPWDAVGGYESFPGQPPMWDWFVQAAAPAPR